jgi:hypothetical protein
MRISEFIIALKKRNALFYYFGWLNIILFLSCLFLFFIDDTIVTGINAWIKPMKFALSVAIYSWTFGWILFYLKSKRQQNFITWVVLICMLVENFIITLQAARDEISHYNISSELNAILFITMGVFITINTFVNLYTLILFFLKSQVTINGNMLVAWRVGLLFFFVGGISGGMMIANMGHTIGAVDGGAGLPFTNWSTQAGDIRAAHFFTLHGLQAIPLFAWFVAEKAKRSTLSTVLFFVVYAVMCLIMHFLALSGKPLISL